MNHKELTPESKRQLASWLRRRLEGNKYADLVSDDVLIEQYFQNAENKRRAIIAAQPGRVDRIEHVQVK